MKKNVSRRCMSHDESPFLDLGDLQGWLAAVGSALKRSSELLMLPESRDIVGYTVPETGVENFELALQYVIGILEE